MPRRSRIDITLGSDAEFQIYTEMYEAGQVEKRIHFESQVQIIPIPSCASFDDNTKRNIWYSQEDFRRMREHHCWIAT